MYGEEEINIFQKEFSVLSAKSENEIVKEFRKYKSVRKKMFYFQTLSQVKISIKNGEISHLLKMNALLVAMRKEVSTLNCLAYRCSTENPIRNVNVIILACKYNQPEVLDFIFSGNCQILQHWPMTVGYNAVLPTDIDEYHHNAFYYAIRSGNTKLVQILTEKWPGDYPFQNSGNFHKVLSNAYRELKLRNVELPIEMEFFVREVLFEESFYHIHETQETKEDFKIDIQKRMELILNNIEILTKEYLKIDVDETFLVIAKFTAKNIHILKRQLRFTYDKIPWEEIEFCLIIFILTVTECKENHLLHARVLSKNRMLMHLENFANCLHNTQDIINKTSKTALQKLPNLNVIKEMDKKTGKHLQLRGACALRITKTNCLFKELYKDYDKLRDEYSLKTMKLYLDLAISVKCDEYGRLIVTRALQVVGEHLKNTLESSKLSDTTCKLLLLSLPNDTREIITDLRDSLSHADSITKRVEIENGNEEFFNSVQDDLRKLNFAIVEVLCQSNIRVIRDELKEISECENLEELKEMLKSLHFENVEEELSEIPVLSQLKKLEILIKEFSCNIKEKTQKEKYLFDKINSEILSEKNRLDEIKLSMLLELNLYNSFVVKSRQNKFENVKNEAKKLLDKTSPNIKFSGLNNIVIDSLKILNCFKLKLNEKELDKVNFSHWKLFYSIAFELKKIKLIEEYKCNIKINKRKVHKKNQTSLNISNQTELVNNLLSHKRSQLKKIDNEIFRDITALLNDKNTQVVVEMLVIYIYSLLEECLSYNHLFLDDEPVTLIGRNIRNHLAHDNTLINILSAHALIDLSLNAKKISEDCILNESRKIGKVFRCNINKLQFEYEQDLGIVALQKEMFMALADSNLEIVKNTLQKGADLKARYIRCKTALHFASEGTSIETVKLVLEEKCDIDAKDENGRSALHIAAYHGRSNVVEYLIKAINMFVDQLDGYNKTPLHIAAEHGHLEIVNILLNSKASTTFQDVHGYTPLHYSVQNNHESIAKALLELEDDVDENDTFGGLTSLYIASSNGHLELVNYLIRRKANVNAETDTLNVPLHAAVQEGHLEIARALISNGANVNARFIDGTTALHMVSTTGQESILQLLLEHKTNVDVLNIAMWSPLTYAAQNGNLGIVNLLLKKKAKVITKDVTGKTPLHFAAENGHQSVVEILLKNAAASLEVADHFGCTAMHYASCNGHTSVVRKLIEHGGNINSRNNAKLTPLNLAAINGHLSVAKVLINAESDVNNSDLTNSTALHRCCEKQFLEIAELLIENKAYIHVPSLKFRTTPFHLALGLCSKAMLKAFEAGGANVKEIKTSDFTALHLGTINGDLEVMQYLIDLNCDVNAKSKSGLTALHLAVEQNNMGAIELLIKNKPNLNICDNNGYTPLNYAALENNKVILKYLMKNGAIVKDEGNGEPLGLAVLSGFHDVVTILLDNGKFDVNVKLRNNESLLNTSVLYSHKKVTEMLLKYGASIDAKSNDITSLCAATFLGDFEMVKLLLSKKANLNVVSGPEKVTPLHVAVKGGHTDIVDILWQGGARKVDSTNKSALQLAVECSRVEVVQFLLEQKGVDVNEKIDGKFSLLHIAAMKNELGIVKCLVAKRADINATDVNGHKPIIWAAKSGHKDIVEYFHKKFTTTDTFQDEFALLLAVQNGHLEVVKYFFENSVDVNSSVNQSETFLHIAAKCNQKEIALYFLDNGAYYNAHNRSGKTPLQVAKCSDIQNALKLVKRLFIAIKCNELELLKGAIKDGAILNVKRKDNATPLHYAAWKGYSDIVGALLKNGANPNIDGRGKSTPLHYAAKSGHFYIVRSLLSQGAIFNVRSDTGKIPLEYSTHKNVTELLSLVAKCFRSVQNGDSEFLEDLKALRDPEAIKAVMKSRNKDNKLLVTLAMRHDFPKIKQLKQVLVVDSNSMYAEAAEHDYCGRYSESLQLLNNIFKIRSEVLGYDNPDTLDIKDKIGEVLLKQHNLEEALKIFEENYKARKESLGANDMSSLHTKRNLAITLYLFGQTSEALKVLQEVYKQQTIIFGKSLSDVLETQIVMATILEQEGNGEKALAQFSIVYELLKESNGENHPQSLMIQADIEMLLSKQKKHNEAIEKFQYLYDTQKVILGAEHLNTLESLRKLADVLYLKGRFNDALKHYKKIQQFQETAYGTNNLPFLTTLHSIGTVYLSQKKMFGAFKIFVKCYNKGLELMGLNHLFTQNARKSMLLAKSQFLLQYGEIGCCILEQVEKVNGCTAEINRRSLEDNIKEASDIYLQRVKCKKIPSAVTRIMSKEYTRSLDELTSDHFIDVATEISRMRAMARGDDIQGTETSTKFLDKDVFWYMTTLKTMHSGIHMKFDDISCT